MHVTTGRRPRRTPPGRFQIVWLSLTAVGALLGAFAPASADETPAPHPVLRGFLATGKFIFQAQGGAKAEAAPKPEPKAEPKPEPKAEPKPEPKAEPEPEPKAEPKPEPKSEPVTEPSDAPKTGPKPEPVREPSPQAKRAPPPRATAPNGGPLVDPPPEPAAEPKPEPKPAPKANAPEQAATVAAPGVYYSRRGAAYLVLGSPLGLPVLVRTGRSAVESFAAESLIAHEDGGVDLRSDVTLTRIGGFTLEGADIVIDVPGLAGRLTPPPPLLGWKTGADLLAHTPEYGRDAQTCPMDAACLATLRGCTNEIRVAVYFGTWCTSCSLLLGRILRLEQDINKDIKEGGKQRIRFDYYGLPAPPATWNDPEANLRRLDHLPTAIVFVNGAYCNRIGAAELGRPDLALRMVLSGR